MKFKLERTDFLTKDIFLITNLWTWARVISSKGRTTINPGRSFYIPVIDDKNEKASCRIFQKVICLLFARVV